MASRLEIVRFLDDLTRKDEFKDYTNNGLQVEGCEEVNKIGFAVDACLQTFEELQDCQMIVCHHGMWWPAMERCAGTEHARLKFLLDRDINVYGSHLPLDAHPQYGNNVQVLKALGFEPADKFGDIGWYANTDMTRDALVERINALFPDKVRYLAFGQEKITRVAVCSGGGGSEHMIKSMEHGADFYITGEAHHDIYHKARERKMNVCLAGHYNTEIFGVQALMPVLEETFGVETRFAEIPTGF